MQPLTKSLYIYIYVLFSSSATLSYLSKRKLYKKKKKRKYLATSPKLYWSYYSHWSRDSVSPVCGIFFLHTTVLFFKELDTFLVHWTVLQYTASFFIALCCFEWTELTSTAMKCSSMQVTVLHCSAILGNTECLNRTNSLIVQLPPCPMADLQYNLFCTLHYTICCTAHCTMG